MKISNIFVNTKPTYYSNTYKKDSNLNKNNSYHSNPLQQATYNYPILFGNKLQGARFAEIIEKSLEQRYAMKADFSGHTIVAKCVDITSTLYEKLFHKTFLPDQVGFAPFSLIFPNDESNDGTLGIHFSDKETKINTILFNADSECYNSIENLKNSAIFSRIQWFHPTAHFLETFVHEFAHSAHYKNLKLYDREYAMDDLRQIKIPNFFLRFLTKFNLGI